MSQQDVEISNTTNNKRPGGEIEENESKRQRTGVGSSVAKLVRSDVDDFILLCSKLKVEQLRPKLPDVLVVHQSDLLPEVFSKLVKANILSVPVVTLEGKYYGFVDQKDIVVYTSNLFNDVNGANLGDIEALFEAESNFNKTRVRDIATYPIRKYNPHHPLIEGSSLYTAMELLANTPEGIHRLPVVDSESNLVDIITQSMLIDFIWQNIEMLGPVIDVVVEDIQGSSNVATINEDTKVINAFRQMSLSGLSGLAVVDEDGKLVDNISLRDLKGIHPDAKVFWRLWNTVKEYKAKAVLDFPPPVPIPFPIYVTGKDSLSSIIEKMALNHIHRVYVVDDEETMRPTKVISQTDVLREVLKRNRGA